MVSRGAPARWLLALALTGCGDGRDSGGAAASPAANPGPRAASPGSPAATAAPPAATPALPTTTPVPPTQRAASPPPVVRHRVVREFPHDPQAFTQGLFFDSGRLYESTGLRGESALREVEIETGKVLREHRLLPAFFGEGAALVGERIVQLTWEAGVGFVYERDSFRLVREFRYPGEGWGLTFDGEHLIMSDGSDTLGFLDPDTFREARRLRVTANGAPLFNLNELEWIDGEIWANLWTDDRIAQINPDTGEVSAFLDLTGILPAASRHAESDVLNGIAFDPESGRIFITGKKWPTLFEIEVVEAEAGR